MTPHLKTEKERHNEAMTPKAGAGEEETPRGDDT